MFKKTLSVVLSMLMVLSCMTALIIPTAAVETPTGTAIDSLDDITDLTADYYLSADIGSADALNTISVGDASNAFTGTLDGNGKTIYTSVPVFALLGAGAEVKNLTVRGSITATNENVGAVSKNVSGSITLTSVVNEASVTLSNSTISNKVAIGGLIGGVGNVAAGNTTTADTDLCTLTMTNCTNKGAITATSTKCIAFVGGLVGGARCAVVMTDCVNDANITASEVTTTYQMRLGGMIGQTVLAHKDNIAALPQSTFTRCINNGKIVHDVTTMAFGAAIVGYYDYQNAYTMDSCVNNGEIAEAKATAGSKTGGMVGVATQDKAHTYISCVNNANITIAWSNVGGIVGQDCGSVTAISCKNKGTITTDNTTKNNNVGGIIGYASSKGNHVYAGCENDGAIFGSYAMGGIVGNDVGVITATDCKNLKDITQPQTSNTDSWSGGLFGLVKGGNENVNAYSSFINCVNEGDLIIKTSKTTTVVGGLVSSLETKVNYVFTNCVNNGDVTVNSDGGGSKTAGIVSAVNAGTAVKVTFVGCVNTGNISAYCLTGGIAADVRVPNKLVACVNTGDVTGLPTTANNTPFSAGMIAFLYAAVQSSIYQCENSGNITNKVGTDEAKTYKNGGGKMSAMIANFNASATITMNICSNSGTIEGDATLVGFVNGTNCYEGVTQTTAAVEFEGIQRSVKVENETTFAVRFITSITNIDQYLSTGVLVYVSEKNSADVKYATKETDTVYTQIGAVANGVNTVYPATPVDGKYFSALTVDGISVSGSYTFIVIPYTVALENSVVAYGDAYTVQVADGEIVSVTALVGGAN